MATVSQSRRLTTPDSALVVDYPDLPDEQLMVRLAMRDTRAFGVLYDRYGTLVYSAALWVVRDAPLAGDIAQEVFFRVWRRPDRYVPQRGRFVTWLLTVARNRAIDHVRIRDRRRVHERSVEESGRALPADEGEDLALTAQLADERERVRRALARLPAEESEQLPTAH